MISVVIAFALSVNDIMLPGSHAKPRTFRIKASVTGAVKIALSFDKKATEKILRVKCDFHKFCESAPVYSLIRQTCRCRKLKFPLLPPAQSG